MKTTSFLSPHSFKASKYSIDSAAINTIPSRRDFYKIWLTFNKGILTLEGTSYTIKQPSLILLHPTVTYSFDSAESDRYGYWCVFTNDFFDTVSQSTYLGASSMFSMEGLLLEIKDDLLNTLILYFDQLVFNYESQLINKYRSARKLIELILLEVQNLNSSYTKKINTNAASRMTSQFFNLLEGQFPVTSPFKPIEIKKPSEFAQRLSVHINHLNAVIQQVTGKSTTQIIAERLLNEGKALLLYSDWTVADIAYSLGFDYPNHFTAFIKKHTGNSPKYFRS